MVIMCNIIFNKGTLPNTCGVCEYIFYAIAIALMQHQCVSDCSNIANKNCFSRFFLDSEKLSSI